MLLKDNEIGHEPIISNEYRRIGCKGNGNCFFHAFSKGFSPCYQATYKDFNEITEKELRKFENNIKGVLIFPSSLFTTQRTNNPSQIYRFVNQHSKILFDGLMEEYREIYVKLLRQDFAYQILNNERMHSIIRRRLSGSIELQMTLVDDLQERKSTAFRNLIRKLSQELLSCEYVKPDFMLLLSDYFNIDIYLLRDEDLLNTVSSPLYSGSSLHDSVFGPKSMRPDNDIYKGESNRKAIILISVNDIHYEIVAKVNESQNTIQVTMSQDELIVESLYKILLKYRNN